MCKELLTNVVNVQTILNICKIWVICDEVNQFILNVGLSFESFQPVSCLMDDLFEGRRCFRVLLFFLNAPNPINIRSPHHASFSLLRTSSL